MFSHFLNDPSEYNTTPGRKPETRNQHDFSMVLEEALDDVGISEEITQQRRDRWFEFEILTTLRRQINNNNNSFYVFGSQIEGSTLPDLASDIDILMCNDSVPVVEELASAPTEGRVYLMCRGEETPAGYVRLQALENGSKIKQFAPYLYSDAGDKVYVKNSGVKKRLSKLGVPLQASDRFVSGPAASFNSSVFGESYDFVGAYRCRHWPSFAYSFFERPRPYNWPSSVMIENFKSLGCFVVPVGHPRSPNQETEFRISFSLQERMLMHSLTSIQLKCYVVLKLIKKEIISTLLGGKSLSSYHLKTCMFYLLEQTHTELWTTENMLCCVQKCLEQLLLWVSKGFCPNYFIPDENMFDRHIHGPVKDKLECILKNILLNNFDYINEFKTNRIGEIVDNNHAPALLMKDNEISREVTKYKLLGKTLGYRLCEMNRLLHAPSKMYHTDAEFISFIDRTLLKLSQIDVITEHTNEQTTFVKNGMIPYLELAKLSTLMASACRNKTEFDSEALIELRIENDQLTPTLKHAMFLFQTDRMRACLDSLLNLEMRLRDLMLSVCGCSARPTCQQLQSSKLPKSGFNKMCFAPCVSFLPAEYILMPLPLRRELIRDFDSHFVKPSLSWGNRDQYHYWSDWVFIDGKFLLYFMLYIAAENMNEKVVSAHALREMKQVIETDPDLGHKETCWDVLGCLIKQCGFADSALRCFIQSYKVRPRFNAAILHIMSLMADHFEEEGYAPN